MLSLGLSFGNDEAHKYVQFPNNKNINGSQNSIAMIEQSTQLQLCWVHYPRYLIYETQDMFYKIILNPFLSLTFNHQMQLLVQTWNFKHPSFSITEMNIPTISQWICIFIITVILMCQNCPRDYYHVCIKWPGLCVNEVISTEESWQAKMNSTVYWAWDTMQYDRHTPVFQRTYCLHL